MLNISYNDIAIIVISLADLISAGAENKAPWQKEAA